MTLLSLRDLSSFSGRNIWSLTGWALFVCVFFVGCDNSNLVGVTGTISVNGEPVGPGSIMFEPVNPVKSTERASIGSFDADGKYEMMSAGKRIGAKPGEYNVTILNGVAPGGEEEEDIVVGKIPIIYENAGLSKLTTTVSKGEDNVIDFDLKP